MSEPLPEKDPLLVAIGERVKVLRARKGMPRRLLSSTSGVSERHLANLETGVGNVSVLVLREIAKALDCPLAELMGDETTNNPEWLLIRELLHDRPEDDLHKARVALGALFQSSTPGEHRADRIALIGLRGAGKSTLAQRLAVAMDRPFVELGEEITRIAGCRPQEIRDLYGTIAYRRYEGRALKETIDTRPSFVMATPGGLVTDPASFNLLLSRCYTVWLRASPAEHMSRVMAQGDLRPMAGNKEAMADLKLILSGRESFYAKADMTFDTAGETIEESFEGLFSALHGAS